MHPAAKSLQSCLTLYDPIDGSPPGSPTPGMLQARTLEWVAISFSNAWKWKVKGKSLSRVWQSFPFCSFPLFLCTDRWGRLSYLFLLFFWSLHSDSYIFPFLLCFSLLFFSQLFCKASPDSHFAFFIPFPWGWAWSLYPVQCHEPPSIVHQALYLSDLGP